MDRGIYTAAAAVETIGRLQETFAHNLANLNTTAFKQRIGYLGEHSQEPLSGLHTPELGTATNYEQGDIYRTGDKLHVALDGSGFYAVDAGTGGILYSRDGRLGISNNGDLITLAGHRVMGGEGVVPPGFSGVNELSIDADGTIRRDGSTAGRLTLTDFEDSSGLRLVASNLFSKPENLAQKPFIGQVRQGYLERSNVSAVDELVQMITFSRIYDNASRVIRTLHETSTRALRQR